MFFFFKQKTAYELRISDWSSDVCSSDLHGALVQHDRVVVAGAYEGDVGQVRHRAVGQVLRAHLVHAVAAARALDDQAELAAAAEARVGVDSVVVVAGTDRSEEHTSELQSLMRNSYAVFSLTQKNYTH